MSTVRMPLAKVSDLLPLTKLHCTDRANYVFNATVNVADKNIFLVSEDASYYFLPDKTIFIPMARYSSRAIIDLESCFIRDVDIHFPASKHLQ
jgi:hypothetical protein